MTMWPSSRWCPPRYRGKRVLGGYIFDVRVFNPYAPSNRNSSISATYRQHENLKKRHYEQRVRQVELASFTPLIFSTTGGLGPAASTSYKRLASMLADKWNLYSSTLGWLRCRISLDPASEERGLRHASLTHTWLLQWSRTQTSGQSV